MERLLKNKDGERWWFFRRLARTVQLREPRYILNSVLDFQDFWLNLMLVGIGLAVLFSDQMAEYYSYISSYSISERYVALYFLMSGTVNVGRLTWPRRINVLWVSFLKTFTASCFLLAFLSTWFQKPVLVTSIVYGILTIISFISLLRSK